MAPCDSEVATTAPISPAPRDPQPHPGLIGTCCYHLGGCRYMWRCIFVFYFTVRFSTCSSRRQVSPPDLERCSYFRYSCSFTPTHKTLISCIHVCVSSIRLGVPEDRSCVLFSSGSPLLAHSLSLSRKDGCCLGQQSWVGVRIYEPGVIQDPKPRPQPTQPCHQVKDCSQFVSDVPAPPYSFLSWSLLPPPFLLPLSRNLIPGLRMSERDKPPEDVL